MENQEISNVAETAGETVIAEETVPAGENVTVAENVEEKSEKELLQILVKNSEKQLFYAKLRTGICLVIAVVAVVSAIIVVPNVLKLSIQASKLVDQASGLMADGSELMEHANLAIDEVTKMSGTIEEMGTKMDSLITDNAESIAGVMKKMNEVDFEGLNKAIADLSAVVEPLANLFSFGKR